MTATDGPLSGFRIIDLTTSLSGPIATRILADMGADVIKIEAPGGDVFRRIGPGRGGMSGFFANVNRGKRSIVLDLRQDEARDVVRRLLADADVFVQNLKVGGAERLGLGAAQLREEFPRLVVASINGFGTGTSRAGDPAYDQIIQALTGIAARQAGKDGVPELVRQGIVDKSTGYTAAQAITAALLRRERTGRGDVVEVSMIDAAVSFVWPDAMANYTCLEDDISAYGDIANSYQLSETKDGHITLNAVTNRQFTGLMEAVGMKLDDRMATVEGRGRHGGETMREVKTRLKDLTTEDAIQRLRDHQVPSAPVVGLGEVRHQPEVQETGILREVEHPVLGRIVESRPAPRMDGLDSLELRPAPALGQDTAEVLGAAGYSDEEIAALRESGAVA